MAFEGLTEKISATFKKLRGKGRLKEADVKEAMREIRMALLEADVSYKVVKDFTKSVTERCIGADVLESLTPAQMIVKIVNEELCKLMGSDTKHVNINPNGPTVVMLVGLQGAGKTTNGSKLAGLMKRQGKNPLLVACDIYRPAAIQQLKVCGEKLEDIEPFHPDRMANRILGMGDVLTLIEKAEKAYDAKKAAEMEEKLKSNRFTLQDFYDQMVQMKSMGSMEEILAQMPGGGNLKGVKLDEKAMAHTEAIILSMTPKEREKPEIIGASRKKRIAAGAGLKVEDVNRLLKSFEQMRKLIKQFSGPGAGKRMKRMGRMGGFGGFPGF